MSAPNSTSCSGGRGFRSEAAGPTASCAHSSVVRMRVSSDHSIIMVHALEVEIQIQSPKVSVMGKPVNTF